MNKNLSYSSSPSLNISITYFLVSQLLVFLAIGYDGELLSYSSDLTPAYAFHCIGILSFAAGYLFVLSWERISKRVKTYTGTAERPGTGVNIRSGFFVAAYAFLIGGIAITIAQVSYFISPAEYIAAIAGGDLSASLRSSVIGSSSEGGLSGILKIFAYAPLSVYLYSLSMLTFFNLSPDLRRRTTRLNKFALIMTLLKVVFILDRLTLMAILVANLYKVAREGRLYKLRFILLSGVAVGLAAFVSSLRLRGLDLTDFLLLYLKLGIVNFQEMIDTVSGHTLGFSTILAPLFPVMRFFGASGPVMDSSFSWVWNDAQYIMSYAYQDFGQFFFLLLLALGALFRVIDDQAINKVNPYFVSIYYVTLYCLISFIFVPAFRGLDFWLALLIPIVLTRVFLRDNRKQLSIDNQPS